METVLFLFIYLICRYTNAVRALLFCPHLFFFFNSPCILLCATVFSLLSTCSEGCFTSLKCSSAKKKKKKIKKRNLRHLFFSTNVRVFFFLFYKLDFFFFFWMMASIQLSWTIFFFFILNILRVYSISDADVPAASLHF